MCRSEVGLTGQWTWQRGNEGLFGGSDGSAYLGCAEQGQRGQVQPGNGTWGASTLQAEKARGSARLPGCQWAELIQNTGALGGKEQARTRGQEQSRAVGSGSSSHWSGLRPRA